MRILIFGLPGSGKTTLAMELVKHYACLYLNGDEVRRVFDDKDFSMEGRLRQAERMRALADMARGIMVIADFVCPTQKARDIFAPDVSIWMDTLKESCYPDTNRIFEIPSTADFIIRTKDAGRHSAGIIEKLGKNRGENTGR